MLPINQTMLPIKLHSPLTKPHSSLRTPLPPPQIPHRDCLHFEQEPIWTTTASDTESSVFFRNVMLLFLFQRKTTETHTCIPLAKLNPHRIPCQDRLHFFIGLLHQNYAAVFVSDENYSNVRTRHVNTHLASQHLSQLSHNCALDKWIQRARQTLEASTSTR